MKKRGVYGEGLRVLAERFYLLLTAPPFIILTLAGNGFIVILSCVFFLIEYRSNPLVGGFIDALWWSFATVTTVGYGDIIPVTFWGKVLGIMGMISGTGLFATYTALFANALLGREVHLLDQSVKLIRRNVAGMQHEIEHEDQALRKQLSEIHSGLQRLEKKLNNS